MLSNPGIRPVYRDKVTRKNWTDLPMILVSEGTSLVSVGLDDKNRVTGGQ